MTDNYGANIFLRNSYAQDGEDIVLDSFFIDKGYKGFYIDLGALHPFRYSNTQIFYERGWRGINIDATPGSMQAFHATRQRDINLEIALSDKKETIKFYMFADSALNNFNAQRSELLVRKGIIQTGIVDITTSTINDVLHDYLPKNQPIDFINIDVEGLELKILSSLDFETYCPHFFLIEELGYTSSDFLTYKKSDVYKLLSAKNYIVVAKTCRTIIFSKALPS